MQILLVLLICLVCVHGESKLVEWFSMLKSDTVRTYFSSHFHEWQNFKKDHGKVYGDMETEAKRYETFRANLQDIEEHNKLYVQGQKSFFLGINEFADMTHEEFKQYMHLDKPMEPGPTGESVYDPPSSVEAPDHVDWRTKGYVTPVKNQGQCGSCWAFSTAGAMEGLHFKKTGQLISLSEQQLVDCSSAYGDKGCKGGWPTSAFKYIRDHGIETDAHYIYRTKQLTCKYDPFEVVAYCNGFKSIRKGSETDLKLAVASQGPVSVCFDASHASFHLYKGGVYNQPNCSKTKLDHALVAVGYGTRNIGGDYWIIKNSWGATWGLHGYVMVSRNKDNQCGIVTAASFPV